MRKQAVWRALVLVLVCAFPLLAEEAPPATTAGDVAALKAQLAAQQEELRQLRELLRRQGLVLETLQRQVGAPAAPGLVAASLTEVPAAPEPVPLEERVGKLEETVAANQQQSEKKLKGLGNFSFSGDLRVRYEPFFQDAVPQRHRERARLRFEARADISKELSGGLRLATGGLGDPITTNQTFTGFFTRKPIDLDRFWLTYKPEYAPWFSITAGKFAYSWQRTELTFDNDLNPEGFSETLSFNFSDSPLTNLTLVGFQLPFNEASTGGDSFIWGGQVQTRWKLNDRTRLGLYATGVNFRNADVIARAMGSGAFVPSLPLSNSVRVDTLGNVIGFAGRFAYLDLLAELTHEWRSRWPVRLTFDFVNNVRAASSERSAYWAELALGRTREKGDWLFDYTLIRIEKDAVIGAYSFSDIRASTNVINHRLHSAYQVHKNVTLEYTLLVGRLFNPQDNLSLVPAVLQPVPRDPFLSRMQFDVIYKF